MIDCFSDEQVAAFQRDGFLIVPEGYISGTALEILREAFARLFRQEYQTGIKPDEVNFCRGSRNGAPGLSWR